jgi:hypothetical protein
MRSVALREHEFLMLDAGYWMLDKEKRAALSSSIKDRESSILL